jgi:hypothetical protein
VTSPFFRHIIHLQALHTTSHAASQFAYATYQYLKYPNIRILRRAKNKIVSTAQLTIDIRQQHRYLTKTYFIPKFVQSLPSDGLVALFHAVGQNVANHDFVDSEAMVNHLSRDFLLVDI